MIERRRISRIAWLLLLASGVSGCDNIFRIDHLTYHGDSGAMTDSRAIDASRVVDDAAIDGPLTLVDAATACASPVLYEPFSDGGLCSPWGTSYATGTALVETNGVLRITPGNNVGAVGGCSSQNNYTFGSGVTAIVNQVLSGTGAYTVLTVHSYDVQIAAYDGQLRYETTAGTSLGTPVTYTAAMKWWRLRPTSSTIVGEYSTNGTSWVMLGTRAAMIGNAVGVEITGGSNNGGNIGDAVFDQLMICP